MKLSKQKNNVAEALNNFLYESRSKAYTSIRTITFISSFAAISLITYRFGFSLNLREEQQVFYGLDIIFGIFVLAYLVRWLYAFRRLDFIRKHWFEGLLISLILINGLSLYLFGYHLIPSLLAYAGVEEPISIYQAAVTIFIFILLFYEIGIAGSQLTNLNIKPASAFLISFLVLIGIGTVLLMMPEMTVVAGSMPFLDALFTSTSAVCVTGLIVVDTATYFTTKGHIVIMTLIQLGGFGILSFASFFTLFLGQGVGIRHQVMLQDFLSSESLFTAKGLIRKIIFLTFIIEFFGFIFLYFTWGGEIEFESVEQKLFFSAFHAISAFCNAGFSLFSAGLYQDFVREAYIFHLIIAGLVILGGIGFPVIHEILSPSKMRERLRNPWKDWSLGTKIAVYVSIALLAFGTISFYLLERNNTLANLSYVEALISSFFQSVVARTAGFNTVDFSSLRLPTYLIIIFLMFIGGSSGSIAGGIKTSTFFLILTSAFATIQGKLKLEIGRNYIGNSLLFRALSIFIFAVGFIALGTLLLTIFEPGMRFIDLFFEEVSAFGTVGLSTGITPELNVYSRMVIICSMFIGRVGTITFAIAFVSRTTTHAYKYPKAHLMVG
ncbi:TrkH family potassium uptake protein [Nafulsella turpanensis]|uniref:TrkH family potassium uptake protein n=1 Tax=Nafulsella turpanensis TaxID=1265690 RepID=UPI000346A1DF|nr:potassium transporter TrkG [Nafulsella turpanensis]